METIDEATVSTAREGSLNWEGSTNIVLGGSWPWVWATSESARELGSVFCFYVGALFGGGCWYSFRRAGSIADRVNWRGG
jgi:hypothetical protein